MKVNQAKKTDFKNAKNFRGRFRGVGEIHLVFLFLSISRLPITLVKIKHVFSHNLDHSFFLRAKRLKISKSAGNSYYAFSG